jgi:hypothetical protein
MISAFISFEVQAREYFEWLKDLFSNERELTVNEEILIYKLFLRATARHIIASIAQRHKQDGVSYGDMACLFRCATKAKWGNLTILFQKLLAEQNIPITVVGGTPYLKEKLSWTYWRTLGLLLDAMMRII